AEFERGGGNDGAEFASLEALLGFKTERAGKASMMRQDGGFAEALRQMMSYFFGQAAGVDEHQRGAMFEREIRQAVVDVLPHLIAGDRVQFVARDFDGQIHRAAMADLDNFGVAAEELRDLFDGADGGGESDFLKWALNKRFEAGDGQGEMRATLRSSDGVNFVYDEGPHAAQHAASAFGGEQDEEGFGRGDQNVR